MSQRLVNMYCVRLIGIGTAGFKGQSILSTIHSYNV